jgi:trehalose/maltose hydrolase-like predicted phosphorylase
MHKPQITQTIWVICVLSGLGICGKAPRRDNDFQFSTTSYARYLPAFVGNGYLFTATEWNGTAASEAVLAGLYDHLEGNSYPYQALIPAWNEVDYWNGSHWLNGFLPAELDARSYTQQLDTYRALLTTHYEWVDGPYTTEISVLTFADRQIPGLGVVRIRITPHYGGNVGPVTVAFPVGGPETSFMWEGAQLPGAFAVRHATMDPDHGGFVAESSSRDGKTRAAEAVRVELPSNLPQPYVSLGLAFSSGKTVLNVKFIARKDRTYTFTKFVAVASSQQAPEPAEEARKIARSAERSGYRSILESHEAAWARLWRTDIRIQGDDNAERTVHAAMFYLLSSLRRGAAWSIPAMGLPSRAYLGRIWWDADTFMFPSMLALHPELAHSMLAYRCRMLPGARLNAQHLGYGGALFPMESASSGEQAAPEWGSEIHVTGDLAMAQWRYFETTGDLQWLQSCGYPILREVANFWTSRVTYNRATDRYEILHVTGPNEAIVDVNNDSYTNAIARRTLEIATQAARLLHQSPNPRWAAIAPKILIPFEQAREHHLEHSGDEQGHYAHALILLTYPLDMRFPALVARNDLAECLANYGKPGYEVGMLGNIYSVVASQLGERDLATRLFLSVLHSYPHPPFYAMTETPTNGRAVFLTGEGAFLQQIIFGFTGLRFTANGLAPEYHPELPATWRSLELHNIMVRGRRVNVRVEKSGKMSITPAVN